MRILIPSLVFALSILSPTIGTAESPPVPDKVSKPAPPPRVECTIPVLLVRDLARSLNFYTTTLGFKLDWGGAKGDTVCSVSRDKCHIMLLQKENMTSPGWVWIGADASLFELYRSKGVKVFQEPKNFSWAYEMKFEDIDGNILWLGAEPRDDLPLVDKGKS